MIAAADPYNDRRQALQRLIASPHPLPDFKGWSIASDMALLIAAHIVDKRPGLVVELGSGISTPVIGQALRKAGQGRLISVEHDPYYYELTLAMLKEQGLQDIVELMLAPLEPCELPGGSQPWYRLNDDRLADGSIDLLVVDGPPGNVHAYARFPTLPKLMGKLSDRAVIIMDDGEREAEQAIADRWIHEFRGFTLQYLPTTKGTFIFERKP